MILLELQLFSAAADVLWKIGEYGRIIQEFIELGAKAKAAASEAMDAEAALGDIPDEFLDPIQVCFTCLLSSLVRTVLRTMVIVSFVAVHFDEGSGHFTFVKNHS